MKKPLIGISPGYNEDKKEIFQLRTYADAVARNGGVPFLMPLPEHPDRIEEMFRAMDGIILSGGPDMSPRFYGEEVSYFCGKLCTSRDVFELALAKLCMEEDKPMMGICKGSQVLNTVCGGKLYQDINLQGLTLNRHTDNGDGDGHGIKIKTGSLLHRITGLEAMEVNSYHHQAIKVPGQGLKVMARSEDGVIEAVELEGKKCIFGVQWHPEKLPDSPGYKLFEYLIACCK